jgi:sulfofructose kinase
MRKGKASILVAGVAVVDFVFRLDELPRAAEKYRAGDSAVVGGGCAANAAVAIARLGGHAVLASRLGHDAIGGLIRGDLAAEGVDCRLVRQFEGFRSSFSSVFVTPAGERQIVNYRDTGLSFDAAWLEAEAGSGFHAALADTRWPQGAAAAMRIARKAGIPGVLDAEAPVREAEEALQLASHVAFSAQGLREFSGEAELEAGLRRADMQLPGRVCVTDGENGVLRIAEGRLLAVPAFAVEAQDTLGAGDVWHGAFALRLGEGAGEEEAMRFANAVAAIKCTRFGGRQGTPRRAEVVEFLDGHAAVATG